MRRIWGHMISSVLPLSLHCAAAPVIDRGFDLQGTVWEKEARQCGISPYLLYAIALKESKKLTGSATAAPSAYALNNPVFKGRIIGSYDEAATELTRYLAASRLTDVGIMQVNIRWNGERVDNPHQLLDVKTNVRVGASVLCDAIARHPGDIELAIGSYHTPNPDKQADARRYGQDVLKIWKRLILLRDQK